MFDKLNNQDVINVAWDAARRNFKSHNQSIHAACGQSIELVLKASVASRTLDNITGVLIAFKNFRKTLKNEMIEGKKSLKKNDEEIFKSQYIN